eukprot:12691137-Prorocentrum_lima.AAC.1
MKKFECQIPCTHVKYQSPNSPSHLNGHQHARLHASVDERSECSLFPGALLLSYVSHPFNHNSQRGW